MQYKDKRTGEIVEVSKEGSNYHVTAKNWNHYVSEQWLNSKFVSITKPIPVVKVETTSKPE